MPNVAIQMTYRQGTMHLYWSKHPNDSWFFSSFFRCHRWISALVVSNKYHRWTVVFIKSLRCLVLPIENGAPMNQVKHRVPNCYRFHSNAFKLYAIETFLKWSNEKIESIQMRIQFHIELCWKLENLYKGHFRVMVFRSVTHFFLVPHWFTCTVRSHTKKRKT